MFKAVGKISVLGTGCAVLNGEYISTVPFELSSDQILLLKMAEKSGFVSISIAGSSGWTQERFQMSIVGFEIIFRPNWSRKDWSGVINKLGLLSFITTSLSSKFGLFMFV